VNQVNQNCIISRDQLPYNKIRAQQGNPREVENNLADGYARDYYTLIACKALGIDVGLSEDEHYNYPQSNRTNPYSSDEDVIDAEYRVLPRHSLPQVQMLPYLQDMLKVPTFSGNYNDKKVKVIAKRKRLY
jgi:hypothetical protein